MQIRRLCGTYHRTDVTTSISTLGVRIKSKGQVDGNYLKGISGPGSVETVKGTIKPNQTTNTQTLLPLLFLVVGGTIRSPRNVCVIVNCTSNHDTNVVPETLIW